MQQNLSTSNRWPSQGRGHNRWANVVWKEEQVWVQMAGDKEGGSYSEWWKPPPPHPPHSSPFLHTTVGYVGHQLINVCQCVRSKKYDFRERSVAAKTKKRCKVRAKGRLKQTGETRGKNVGRLERPRRLSATAKRSSWISLCTIRWAVPWSSTVHNGAFPLDHDKRNLMSVAMLNCNWSVHRSYVSSEN